MSRLPRKGFTDDKIKDSIEGNLINMVRQYILLS